jgi:hypothetical protein
VEKLVSPLQLSPAAPLRPQRLSFSGPPGDVPLRSYTLMTAEQSDLARQLLFLPPGCAAAAAPSVRWFYRQDGAGMDGVQGPVTPEQMWEWVRHRKLPLTTRVRIARCVC